MKKTFTSALIAVLCGAFVSCSGIAIQSLDTKYGKLTTNLDGSQSFTTKAQPGDEPVVVGTVVTEKGTVTVNPDGSYTFTSKPAVVEVVPVAPTVEGDK